LNLNYFGSKCTALKKKLATLLRLFGAPQWFGTRGNMPPFLRPWCDTSRQSAQLWNSQSPECRTTSNWENTTTLVRSCIHNTQRKMVRQALLAKTTGKRPRCCPNPRWTNCISDLAWSCLGVDPA